jgi:Mrp family chromosome partitioning ATPase
MLSSVGSRSGEDTAEIIANLGVVLAQAGKRVVLADAQFHNPWLTELFESSDKSGLAEYIGATSSKLKLIQVKNVAGVQLLPAGTSLEKNSGALLNSEKITGLMEDLQKGADIVLFAGAPISWFAESLTLAAKANGVILVARPGETRAKMVSEVVEGLRDIHVNLVGVIFDNNPARFTTKPKLRDVYKSTQVVSEDSPV